MIDKPWPIVVVTHEPNGDVTFHRSGDVMLLIVDERTPDDRVYEYSGVTEREAIIKHLGSDAIGFAGDGSRGDGVAQKIKKQMRGEDDD